MLSKKRILNDDYELYEGRHEAIITEEQWDQVQEILNRHKHTSNHTERQLKTRLLECCIVKSAGEL